MNEPDSSMMWSMELKAAQESFMNIFQQMQQPETQKAFLLWIDATFIRPGGGGSGAVSSSNMVCNNGPSNGNITGTACNSGGSDGGSSNSSTTDYAADSKLRRIADDVREMMPLNAILPTEQITFPSVGENADCDPSHTLHVDAFLYDEDLVDELCDTGELGRNYCLDCSSHNTQPITYVSHSASRERLAYVFRALLPPVPEDAVIVDVGSRLGAVLYGAYVYTKCRRIIGVELNEDLCQLQRTIVTKYNFQDRISVVSGDVQLHGTLMNSADVVVMNNVFEFFMAAEVQLQIWNFLRASIKRGALLVTIPALTDTLQHFDVGFRVQDWVREVPPHDPNVTAPFDFQSETSEVKLYQVI
ncbi:uncharacterized protein LOC108666887 isoform X2 [Hyalella azteca]|uniref:Uncharacterized protein LOC108666887 isoform X2 n=1 Tax=Hyalella azteca TaxID=294128 RepID=A0A8B7N618_HYAAZ|nr:uncharacterized protein LOC108666887 isoform X2 [Hyalella azteca]